MLWSPFFLLEPRQPNPACRLLSGQCRYKTSNSFWIIHQQTLSQPGRAYGQQTSSHHGDSSHPRDADRMSTFSSWHGKAMTIVKLLLQFGVPIDAGLTTHNDDGDLTLSTGLSVARKSGYDSVVRLLIEHGAEVNVNSGVNRGMTPILATCASGHLSTVQILLDAGAKVKHDIDKGNALFGACAAKDGELVRFLIEKGADIEKRPTVGFYAPLH
ncbi:hypothetical protein M427DRAFT_61699 [Gonapodya prolifera JEL478]|uniref:Uncharacterized protein n=1 Tax=Gonapodya prolifera (strain JEL478) TaxID=1344416 RepID=A0A139A2Z8_GONPJ|nr:hypothetical protein M427DRAFT_61699 [Gonapodya prolifera JEL478]|eukprot:KXS10753.1 hypothetical protein M427DRAFT_61699 [Gonapodya prolifera JEL478]